MKDLLVSICRLRADVNLPQYKPETAACFDFEAAEDCVIKPNEIKKIPTGLVISVPKGFFLMIAPRSSTPKKGLQMPHSFGVIDPTYCGKDDEILIVYKNVTDTDVLIEKGERIAQANFIEVPITIWQEISINELPAVSRGGFGSTNSK